MIIIILASLLWSCLSTACAKTDMKDDCTGEIIEQHEYKMVKYFKNGNPKPVRKISCWKNKRKKDKLEK